MATSLAAQLAQIAVKSKSSLDVKAQKAAHSKSLIFEPRIAASQSFQTVYTLCHDGFQELCRLDGRFFQYTTTIFSEQSQEEDRTQMTAAENAELDKTIESFLRLSGSRLRLMPTIKAIEWLIRRFRIHEFNTAFLIASFLPYHSIPVFTTLMSILPSDIPNEYKFLDPYIRSLTAPPHAAIVRQATQKPALLSAISTYTLDSCRAQQHYPALVVFWGGIMTEAVNGLVDRLKSGRKSLQLDHDQTLLQQIGPPLGEAMAMKSAPGVQIASYMVVAVFVSKSSLNDPVLSAFMETLVVGWNASTIRPGLVCLSVLAQHRSGKQLPSKVTKAMLKIQKLHQILSEISREHRIDRLANGLVLSLVDRLAKKAAVRGLPVLKSILLADILQEKQLVVAFKALLLAAHQITNDIDKDGDARRQLGSCLVSLSQAAGSTGKTIRAVIEDVDFDIEELELKLDASMRPRLLPTIQQEDVAISGSVDVATTNGIDDISVAMERLSELEYPDSCLCQASDSAFEQLSTLLLAVSSDQTLLQKLDAAPILGRDEAMSRCFYLTFQARIWSGPYPTLVRVAALDAAKNLLSRDDCLKVDFQALLPYAITAMTDPAKKVRRAAASLLVTMDGISRNLDTNNTLRWAEKQLYEESDELKWLDDTSRRYLLQVLVIPSLEEAILHEGHLPEVLQSALNSSSKPSSTTEVRNDEVAQVPHSTRLSIFGFFASHAVYSPLLTLKVRLLRALNQVRGVSSTSRTPLLLPLLQWWASLTPEDCQQLATREGLDEAIIDSSCVDVVLPGAQGGPECFLEIVKQPASNRRPRLIHCIFGRMRKLWPSMKGDAQVSMSQALLELSQRPTLPGEEDDVVSEQSADLLRSVKLSIRTLLKFLNDLQDLPDLMENPQPNKRRRTSPSDADRGAIINSSQELRSTVRQMTFVLQLVEGSNPAEHPELLQSLFLTLSKLQIIRSVVGSELGYLQHLVLGSLLAMMPTYKLNKNLAIDTSIGHGEILIKCIRKSSSPAVQNAALLLVAALATTAPDIILHSVMPIFAFMSTSVLRQSDDYSAHVITQTVKEVVPPLIDTLRKGKKNVVASASELLSSFVISYEHIPSHRKRGLFVSLVDNLGPGDFLFALVAMFADKYGQTDSVIAFLTDLVSNYSAEIQLQAFVAIVDLIADIFKPKPGLSAVLLSKKEDGEHDLQKSAAKELAMLPQLLTNRTLKDEVGRLADRDDMETAKIRELYAALLEGILLLADTVKSKKSLHNRCGETLANLLNLLSISEFIKAVETLLDRPNIGLRQKVLKALEVRVDDESNTDPKSRTALLGFLPQLTAVIRDSDDIPYKHTAVTCVDKIAEKYGKKDIEAVVAAASIIASDHCLGQPQRRLRIMALFCLASLVDVLHDSIVPILPVAVPKTLEHLQSSIDGVDSDTELHNAAYAFVTALAERIPYMISVGHLIALLTCSSRSAEAGLDDEANGNRRDCLQTLTRQVDAKVMFSALQATWPVARDAGDLALGEYLEVLGMALDHHSKANVAKNVLPLTAIFQGALDVRREARARDGGSPPGQHLTKLEGVVNEVALKMIYKLNDAAFRPIFSRLLEWSDSELDSGDNLGRTLRQQSVYGFLTVFFDKLKSIVTNYATYVVDSAVNILQEVDLKKAEDKERWRRVLKTLAKCFEHDQDGFWQTPSHFGAIAPVLVEQFQHASVLDLSEELIPAVVELAAAVDSQDHRKELNTGILRHSRSEHASVRLAAVKCEQALTDRLGDEWLQMLPEMLPHISELQDDDDEVVDRETHRWIGKIERVLGESLDSMLQ